MQRNIKQMKKMVKGLEKPSAEKATEKVKSQITKKLGANKMKT